MFFLVGNFVRHYVDGVTHDFLAADGVHFFGAHGCERGEEKDGG